MDKPHTAGTGRGRKGGDISKAQQYPDGSATLKAVDSRRAVYLGFCGLFPVKPTLAGPRAADQTCQWSLPLCAEVSILSVKTGSHVTKALGIARLQL